MKAVGLAGKPNAGKSTFYKAATLADVDVGDYPFTTIDANRGVAHVRTRCPCLDLDERCGNCEDGRRYVGVELVDVAGLVPGAHEGRGLGNQFLDELRQADAVLNVVDASGGTDEEGEPCDVGEHDPRGDVEFLRCELDMWLKGIVEDNWEKIERKSRAPEFDFEAELTQAFAGIGATEADVRRALREVDPPEFGEWTDGDREALARELRRSSKPLQVAANKADVAPDDLLQPLVDDGAVPTSAASELALRQATEQGVVNYHPGDGDFDVVGDVSDEQREGLERIREFVDGHGGTGVQEALDTAVYDLLDMVTVYPVEEQSSWRGADDEVLPDAFLLPEGATPVDLAYEIHSDIGEGYHHAVDCRSGRKIGEGHELEEGDVVKIATA